MSFIQSLGTKQLHVNKTRENIITLQETDCITAGARIDSNQRHISTVNTDPVTWAGHCRRSWTAIPPPHEREHATDSADVFSLSPCIKEVQ